MYVAPPECGNEAPDDGRIAQARKVDEAHGKQKARVEQRLAAARREHPAEALMRRQRKAQPAADLQRREPGRRGMRVGGASRGRLCGPRRAPIIAADDGAAVAERPDDARGVFVSLHWSEDDGDRQRQ